MKNEIEVMKLGFIFLGLNISYDEKNKLINIFVNEDLIYTKKYEYNRNSILDTQYNMFFLDKEQNKISYCYDSSKGIYNFRKGENLNFSIKINKENNEIEHLEIINKNREEQFKVNKLEIKNDSILIKLNTSIIPEHSFSDEEIRFICNLSPKNSINLLYKKIYSRYNKLKVRTLRVLDNQIESTNFSTIKKSEKQIKQFSLTVLSHEEIKELFDYIMDIYDRTISPKLSNFILNYFDISKLITESNLTTEEVNHYINSLYLEDVEITKKEENLKVRKRT